MSVDFHVRPVKHEKMSHPMWVMKSRKSVMETGDMTHFFDGMSSKLDDLSQGLYQLFINIFLTKGASELCGWLGVRMPGRWRGGGGPPRGKGRRGRGPTVVFFDLETTGFDRPIRPVQVCR